MKHTLRNTWTILDKKEKKQFVILILLGILISIADILALVSLLWIINFYIQPTGQVTTSFLPGWMTDKDSVSFIAIFFVLFSLKNIAGFLISKAHYKFSSDVAIRISQNNLIHFQQSPFTEFINIDSSVPIRKIALQPFEFAQHVLAGLQQIIIQLCLIIISIAAIFIFNAKLFLLLLIILLPPVVLLFFYIRKRLASTKKQLRHNNEISYQYLLDSLKGYVEANIYQRNDFFLNRFIETRKQFSFHLFNSLSLQNLPGRLIEIFAVLGLFILIFIAKSSGNENSNTFITMGAFMAAAYKIIPGIVKLINLTGQVRVYEFSAEEIVETEKQIDPIDVQPVTINSVEFKKISFQYAERQVLNKLSFTISKGELLGISAVSGKGKTTILNLLLGFLTPATGEILVNNKSAAPASLKQYWPSVAYVRQQSFFIYDTIRRNITLEEKDNDNERMEYSLRISGLEQLISSFPEGLGKIITENGKNISGGQQQRIAIARALYKNADLVLLDEPFNELDNESALSMLEHFKEIATNKIVILITHDKKCLSFCTKIISLDE